MVILQVTDNVLIAQNGDRDFVPNKVIVLTDGKSTLGQENLANEIYRLKQNTDGVFVAGMGELQLQCSGWGRVGWVGLE